MSECNYYPFCRRQWFGNSFSPANGIHPSWTAACAGGTLASWSVLELLELGAFRTMITNTAWGPDPACAPRRKCWSTTYSKKMRMNPRSITLVSPEESGQLDHAIPQGHRALVSGGCVLGQAFTALAALLATPGHGPIFLSMHPGPREAGFTAPVLEFGKNWRRQDLRAATQEAPEGSSWFRRSTPGQGDAASVPFPGHVVTPQWGSGLIPKAQK